MSNVKVARGDSYSYHPVSITWDNPTDNGFNKVLLELYFINLPINEEGVEYENPFLKYSSGRDKNPDVSDANHLVLEKNKFSYGFYAGGNFRAIIKCIDKFGNISNGVQCNFDPSVVSR